METTPVEPLTLTQEEANEFIPTYNTPNNIPFSIPQTNHLQRIDSVETSVNDIKSEILTILSTLRNIIQSSTSSNQ